MSPQFSEHVTHLAQIKEVAFMGPPQFVLGRNHDMIVTSKVIDNFLFVKNYYHQSDQNGVSYSGGVKSSKGSSLSCE